MRSERLAGPGFVILWAPSGPAGSTRPPVDEARARRGSAGPVRRDQQQPLLDELVVVRAQRFAGRDLEQLDRQLAASRRPSSGGPRRRGIRAGPPGRTRTRVEDVGTGHDGHPRSIARLPGRGARCFLAGGPERERVAASAEPQLPLMERVGSIRRRAGKSRSVTSSIAAAATPRAAASEHRRAFHLDDERPRRAPSRLVPAAS